MIKGSLLLSAPIIKHFRVKKKLVSPVLAKIWQFLGINRGLNIKFKFYNSEKAHPCVISRLMSYRA